jgi:hypothetical protein
MDVDGAPKKATGRLTLDGFFFFRLDEFDRPVRPTCKAYWVTI